MSLITSEGAGGSSISPISEGVHVAICNAIIDLGLQYNKTYGKEQARLMIGWEICDETIKTEDGEKNRTFWNRYSNSLSEKSFLRKDLAAWRGRDFTPEELKRFDLRAILGVPCYIQIIHKQSGNGETYANIASIMALPKGMPRPVGTIEHMVYDIDADDPNKVDELPNFISKVIMESSSWKARMAEKAAALDDLGDRFSDLVSVNEGEIPF